MVSKPLSFNAPGRFATLEKCEGCGQCQRLAPDNVSFDPSDVYCYVYRQPETEAEVASIERAMKLCPACAMKDSGGRVQKGME